MSKKKKLLVKRVEKLGTVSEVKTDRKSRYEAYRDFFDSYEPKESTITNYIKLINEKK